MRHEIEKAFDELRKKPQEPNSSSATPGVGLLLSTPSIKTVHHPQTCFLLVQIHRSRFSILNSANDSPLIRTASARPPTPPPLEKLAAAFRAPASVFRFCFFVSCVLDGYPLFYSTLHSILFPPSGVGVSHYITSSMGLICEISGCCSLYLYTSPPHPLLAPLHCPLEYVRVRECVCWGGRLVWWVVCSGVFIL